ncbi:hypothetical protein [Pseudidiomarina maritima]|uniref:hypothetical protein n=1 Tax=Pseudidiomarina maritima TaxID=519453 RepID=UPI0015A6D667|nr:hypothetical protein [Pseudidiomarina maritima]
MQPKVGVGGNPLPITRKRSELPATAWEGNIGSECVGIEHIGIAGKRDWIRV